eukprot:1157685-Pelagomonas_calceolata.AAC.9
MAVRVLKCLSSSATGGSGARVAIFFLSWLQRLRVRMRRICPGKKQPLLHTQESYLSFKKWHSSMIFDEESPAHPLNGHALRSDRQQHPPSSS